MPIYKVQQPLEFCNIAWVFPLMYRFIAPPGRPSPKWPVPAASGSRLSGPGPPRGRGVFPGGPRGVLRCVLVRRGGGGGWGRSIAHPGGFWAGGCLSYLRWHSLRTDIPRPSSLALGFWDGSHTRPTGVRPGPPGPGGQHRGSDRTGTDRRPVRGPKAGRKGLRWHGPQGRHTERPGLRHLSPLPLRPLLPGQAHPSCSWGPASPPNF